MKLIRRIRAIRSELALAAQAVYDSWEQDADGMSEDFGGGGICDAISEAMGNVIASELDGVDFSSGGQDGDDHAFVVVMTDAEAIAVDIPPGIYEIGGGYSWRKRIGVVFTEDDISLAVLERGWFDDE